MAYWLSSFHPLCENKAGRAAAKRHNLPPFIDGSIRREPDLQHEFPAITALCRKGRFAPKLRVGDHVAYITVTGSYGRRLVAILKVKNQYDSHEEAALWYQERCLSVPSNCLIAENPPLDLCYTNRARHKKPHPKAGELKSLEEWDDEYLRIKCSFGAFLVCDVIYKNLENPPILTDDRLKSIFGRIPGTQTPSDKYSAQQFAALATLLRDTSDRAHS